MIPIAVENEIDLVKQDKEIEENLENLESQLMASFADRAEAYVGGEKFCRHINSYEKACPKASIECFESKGKNCHINKKYEVYFGTIRYLDSLVKELKTEGQNVSQLSYYLDLARERVEQAKFSNARIYLNIVRKKARNLQEKIEDKF